MPSPGLLISRFTQTIFRHSPIENNIVPRCSDAAAADRATSLVKVLRYWQGREKYGAAFLGGLKAELTEQQFGNPNGEKH